MPRRIVIHAGFHKTGTSTVQQVLRSNRAALKPYLRSVLKWGMSDLLHAARGYSTWRDTATLDKFARRFRGLLQRHSDMPRRTLCLSAEELSGHMPGRENIPDYAAAPVLANEMARVAQEVHPKAELVFFYSTRDPESWLESAYWEHVKSSAMTQDFDAFRAGNPDAADLDGIIDRIAAALPDVHCARIEAHRDIPAAPLLALAGVPDAVIGGLPPAPRANARPDRATLHALLDANRRYTNREERIAAKQALLQPRQEDKGD